MSENSSIEWTDTTWNPVRGCTKVSPGCAHCYAETFAERFRGVKGHPYEQGFDLRLVPEKLDEPLKWKTPRKVFVNSMSDLFQVGVEWSFVERVFETMQATPQHTYQVLTKRPADMLAFAEFWAYHHDGPLKNVGLGVSVENGHFLSRVDVLKDTPAGFRFVSFEPLLESVGALFLDGIDWCIVGGESGRNARPFNIEWAREIVRECRRQRVAVFVKQLGSNAHIRDEFGGKFTTHISLQSSKGGDMSEWPEDLRVREFPSQPSVVLEMRRRG